MMGRARVVRISKYLSKHLRHEPQALGLTLAPGGWVPVASLLEAARRHGFSFSRAELDTVVATNDKQRFRFDLTGTLIRANQGHSVPVDLALEPLPPPPVLYHGTATRFVQAILTEGLRRMQRQHVHLSADIPTARRVGARHGRPVILVVDAAGLAATGTPFYRSANGVWLVEAVPPAYLRIVEEEPGTRDEGQGTGDKE